MANYDNLRNEIKENSDYTEVQSLLYAKFPVDGNNAPKPDQPPPPKPLRQKEGEAVNSKPPVDRSRKKFISALYNRLSSRTNNEENTNQSNIVQQNESDKQIEQNPAELNYDNLNKKLENNN